MPNYPLEWVDADRGPFGIRFLDCRAVTLAMTSVTADRSIADRYKELRRSDGRHLLEARQPVASLRHEPLVYGIEGVLPAGALFRAIQVEDK